MVNMSHNAECCPVCQKTADKLCSGCHSISYCSAAHQKQDWKSHRNSCRTFIVKRNAIFGRYTVAARDLSAGDIIMREDAIIVGPKRVTFPICLGCHKKVFEETYLCSKCCFPVCSPDCENLPVHSENECKVFQLGRKTSRLKIANYEDIQPAYECILPLRCLLLRDREPKKWNKLIQMEHNNDLRKDTPDLWNRNEVNTVKLLRERFDLHERFDSETIHSVIGFIDVNAFEIKTCDIEICGVYPDGALMCHDCVPNTHFAITDTEKHTLIVRASVPIKKGDMITTSYADQLLGTLKRRTHLRDTKYFDCLCTRCTDPSEFGTFLSGIKCSNPLGCNGFILPKYPMDPKSEWICTSTSTTTTPQPRPPLNCPNAKNTIKVDKKKQDSCSNSMQIEQVQNILALVQEDIKNLETDETIASEKGIVAMENLLTRLSGQVLHPNHYLLLTVVQPLMKMYGRKKGWYLNELSLEGLQRKKQLCLQILGVLDKLDPGHSRNRAVALYELHGALYHICLKEYETSCNTKIPKAEFIGRLQEVMKCLQEAKDILELDKLITSKLILGQIIQDNIDIVQTEMLKCH